MRHLAGWIVIAILLTATVTTAQETSIPVTVVPEKVRPQPAQTLEANGVQAALLFPSLPQGGVGVIELRGDNITEARVLFGKNDIHFIRDSRDASLWYALVVADIDLQPRDYGITILIRREDGATDILTSTVPVTNAAFIRQQFAVPSNISYLINPEVERNEFARIDAITNTITDEPLWDENGFMLPIDANITSGFGQYRILNQSVQTRHTGWDQRAPVGTQVGAIAAGTVAYAGQLDIRGNYIMINHGWGIYSGYAHLSQMNVERGQSVQQGQIIGLSGNTGRSSGPHLHWEIVVNREWVDSLNFINLWLPEID